MADSIDDTLAQVEVRQLRSSRKELQDYVGRNMNSALAKYQDELRSENPRIKDMDAFTDDIKTALLTTIREYLKIEGANNSTIDLYASVERDLLNSMFQFDPARLAQSLADNHYDFDKLQGGLIGQYKEAALRYLDNDSTRLLTEVVKTPAGLTKMRKWAKALVERVEPAYQLTKKFLTSREPSEILGGLQPFWMDSISQYGANAESNGLIQRK